MRRRILLAILLLAVVFCLFPVTGYGKVWEFMIEEKASDLEVSFLEARIDYIMNNPTNYLDVSFAYDVDSSIYWDFGLPTHVITRGKICISIHDTRGVFSYKSGTALLDEFNRSLKAWYWYIVLWVTDMENDIFAIFWNIDGNPLGYFYQGEYHLWEE